MDNIISTAYLMGGLGNQMFQISHAIAQGLKNNKPSVFLLNAYTPMQAHQPKKYVNNIFKKIKFTNTISNTKRIFENCFNFSNIDIDWTSSIEFYGYFQSNKNFLGYDNYIKELFQPTEEFINFIKLKYPEINNERTVSLHIRRGDYLTISHAHPVIDKSYIDEAINQNGNYDNLFIFSDDIEWVRENLSYSNQIIVSEMEDYEELWMMSLCKNNIMSNSSFSWWGSFLNKNEDKKVFVPDVWFGPSINHNTEDIYLKSWNKINVKFSDGKLIHIKN